MTQLYTFSAFEKFNVDYSHTVYSREMILVHTLGVALSYKLKVIPDFYHHLLSSYHVYKCTLFSLWEVVYLGYHGTNIPKKVG